MSNYDLNKVQKLLQLSSNLINSPEEASLDRVQDIIDQLIEFEENQENLLNAEVSQVSTRGKATGNKVVVSETPVAVRADDSLGNLITIVLEVEQSIKSLHIIGILHANLESPWVEYTVVVSQDGIIEDFADTSQGENFTLQLRNSNDLILKFISASRDVILLESIKIDLDN